MKKHVCIFCGASSGHSDRIIENTEELCRALIDHDYHLVYGGGKTGLMGIIASLFLEAGKEVIGIRPKKLIQDEDVHNGLSSLIEVEDLFDRKSKMLELAQIFIGLPGGVGTLDEVMDVYTQVKIGFMNKKIGLLNVDYFYEPLLKQLRNMNRLGFLKTKDMEILMHDSEPSILINKLL